MGLGKPNQPANFEVAIVTEFGSVTGERRSQHR